MAFHSLLLGWRDPVSMYFSLFITRKVRCVIIAADCCLLFVQGGVYLAQGFRRRIQGCISFCRDELGMESEMWMTCAGCLGRAVAVHGCGSMWRCKRGGDLHMKAGFTPDKANDQQAASRCALVVDSHPPSTH